MAPNSRRSALHQAGFTLVEIMVGLAIGMLATIIIIQVISVFEAQRRTTAGTADAQTNGAIALYNIGRELQMAGYPLMPVTDSALECATLTVNGVAVTPDRLAPVTIADNVVGAGANASPSDTLTVRYGTAPMGGVPTQTTTASILSAAPVDVPVLNNLGCQPGDTALITIGNACAMSTVTAVSAVGAPVTVSLTSTPVAPSQTNLACLGTWNQITYRVNNGNLERNGVASVAGIVNLQVQYGISAAGLVNSDPNFNRVTQWVDARTLTWDASTITVANRNRIKGIRIAVVARNAKIEPAAVTAACSSTIAAAPTGLCAWAGSAASPAPAIDLSAGDADWARYRYRVFETIIPLRNTVWSKDTL